MLHRPPFVHLKMAVSTGWKVATATADSRWITGEVAGRACMSCVISLDAIMVGGRTRARRRSAAHGSFRQKRRRPIVRCFGRAILRVSPDHGWRRRVMKRRHRLCKREAKEIHLRLFSRTASEVVAGGSVLDLKSILNELGARSIQSVRLRRPSLAALLLEAESGQ